MIEGATIAFRNFSGKEGRYNQAGKRNFCVFLDDDLAETLKNDGWNVRWLEPRDDQDDKQPYMQVTVGFDFKPPNITLITSKGRTTLDAESISLLDWADIEKIDLVIRPYDWKVNEKEGVKAYVKSMYVILAEDEFAHKYYDVPDSADSSMCDGCTSVTGSCADCQYSGH